MRALLQRVTAGKVTIGGTTSGEIGSGLVILLGVFAGAVVLTLLAHAWKQHKLQRLKDPHRDYYRR